jgi:hypothetical protein
MPIILTNNPYSESPDLYPTKLERDGYLGNAQTLDKKIDETLIEAKSLINSFKGSAFLGSITPSSTPTGTGRAFWLATQSGTYTNFGGLAVSENSFAVISRNEAGAFSISQTALNLTLYASKTYVDGLVVGLLDDRGSYNASVNTFPATGGSGESGLVKKGDLWYVSVAGVLGGKSVKAGASFRALIDSPAQVFANWAIFDANLGFIPENSGNKSSDIIADPTSTDKFPSNKGVVEYIAANGGKIKTFINQAYPIDSQVNSLGKDWTANSATVAGDIPGTSTKWTERLFGYNYNNVLKANISFNEKEFTGRKLNSNTGIIESTGSGNVSEYISVNPLLKYGVSNLGNSNSNHAGVVFYDIDKLEIASGIVVVASTIILETGILITPSNAVFMRIGYAPTRVVGVPILYSISSQQLANDIIKVNLKIDQNKIINESLLKVNIVFNEKAISGSKLSSTTGVLSSTGFGFVSEYISINPLLKYGVSNLGFSQSTHAGVIFYDIDKTIILSNIVAVALIPILETGILIIPANAVFMRITYDPTRITGIPILYSISTQQLANDIKKLDLKIDNISNAGLPIQFWGDSIGSQIASQAATLSPIDGRIINNKCIGGETTLDTLAKMNIYPYSVSPFTIPADSINVVINLTSSFGEKNKFNFTTGEIESRLGSTSINPWDNLKCEIQGVSGTIYFKRGGDNVNHYFKRDIAGSSVLISRSTRVVIKGLNKKIIPVVFMGTNGGWDKDWGVPQYIDATFEDADNLVNYYKEIVRFLEPASNNFLFLGYYKTAFSDQKIESEYKLFWDYFHSKMSEAFGNKFLNVKEYLRSYGWKDAGYQLGTRIGSNSTYTLLQEDIDLDIENISRGKIPHCVVGATFATHLTAKVSACVANQVVKRLYEMNLVSTMPQINITNISDFGPVEFEN